MHIITAKIKVFQKPQAFLTIIMIYEAFKKQTEYNYYICNKMYLYYGDNRNDESFCRG